MAGTDTTKPSAIGGPAVILVDPQLGENIGTTARAMLNFGLTDLRLVRPRDGWPNAKALNAASGADEVIAGVRIFDVTADALTGLHRVYAATARDRHMVKPVVTPRFAAAEMRKAEARGFSCGIIFGPERTGLHNDDVVLADAVLTLPLNPAFSSLNLAQAVLAVAYEWFQAGDGTPPNELPLQDTRPATKDELVNFFGHLERELDAVGFFPTPETRPAMVRNLRNLFGRMALTEQDVQTLHGVVARLREPKKRASGGGGDGAS